MLFLPEWAQNVCKFMIVDIINDFGNFNGNVILKNKNLNFNVPFLKMAFLRMLTSSASLFLVMVYPIELQLGRILIQKIYRSKFDIYLVTMETTNFCNFVQKKFAKIRSLAHCSMRMQALLANSFCNFFFYLRCSI